MCDVEGAPHLLQLKPSCVVPSPAELALLTNKPRAATVTATGDVVCAGEVGRGGGGEGLGRRVEGKA